MPKHRLLATQEPSLSMGPFFRLEKVASTHLTHYSLGDSTRENRELRPLAWAKLSSIFEPANHVRKVIGFDTFSGFPSVAVEDTRTGTFPEIQEGGLSGSSLDNVSKAVSVYDLNRPINHIQKIELVCGDLCKTATKYLENNPHLVVSLLYLDLDLYEPTKKSLEVFLPRMPKGAIIAFDELNAKIFPGETMAVIEQIGVRNLRIERFAFDSYVSYAVLD